MGQSFKNLFFTLNIDHSQAFETETEQAVAITGRVRRERLEVHSHIQHIQNLAVPYCQSMACIQWVPLNIIEYPVYYNAKQKSKTFSIYNYIYSPVATPIK